MGWWPYIRRIYRSLRENGPLKTVQAASSFLRDSLFDLRYGTDTMGWAPLARLAIRSGNVQAGNGYQASKAVYLREFLQAVRFPPGSEFVDLGCGKGRVLLIASRCGFAQVTGVEFSPELCAIARRNAEIWRRRYPDCAPVSVTLADCAHYEVRAEQNVFFMFNPFDERVLKPVLGTIADSVRRFPRPAWIVYYMPVYRRVIDADHRFSIVQEYRYAEAEFLVYQVNLPGENFPSLVFPSQESLLARKESLAVPRPSVKS